MTDFLLELRCEEIPARMQVKASEDLARLFTEELAKSGLKAEAIESFVTPRRLALIARGLPLQTEAVSEEFKGPRTSAPAQALEGFLRKTGLTQDQLEDRDGVWFAVVEKPGRATADVLAQAIPAIVRAFPWPKSMRWGTASQTTESLRWVRPLQGIIALLGGEVVPVEIDGIASGRETVGHRFHSSGTVSIDGADDYAAKLRAAYVIASHEERQAIIADKAAQAAAAKGYTVIEDKGLVAENAGLTEWPVPLLGDFDPAFLEVPPEVIQLTLRINQKYFVLRDASGKLAPAFICTANIEAKDGGTEIVAGNRKVLAARLSDARFFWEQDKKTKLEVHAEKLSRITFHEKLGTVADKVERVAKLARWLVEEGIVIPSTLSLEGEGRVRVLDASVARDTSVEPPHPSPLPAGEREQLAALAEQAARLAKADLVTEMVGEFPELQGIMGGYYARAEGLPDAVADAIRDHYKPVGQGDDVPTAPVTVAVSLADKLDTLAGFFAVGERPTGSKDPFALRRAALAIIRLIVENELAASLTEMLREARNHLIDSFRSKYKIVSIDPDAASSEPFPALPAQPAIWGAGEIYLVNSGAEPETFVVKDGTSYSAYSREFLEESDQVKVKIASLTDLVGDGVLYFTDRIEEAERRSGVRADIIRAVVPREIMTFDVIRMFSDLPNRKGGPGVYKARRRNWGYPDEPVQILARVKALQSFVGTEDGANLLAGYRRAANILKKEGVDIATSAPIPEREGPGVGAAEGGSSSDSIEGSLRSPPTPNPSLGGRGTALNYTPEPAEAALLAALDTAEPLASAAIADEDFEGAMAALASLRGPIDAFFEGVTVNDADPAKRAARLALLARVRAAVHQVADFSRIEG